MTTTGGSGRLYWWDASGKQGQWVAPATFTNSWERGSYLTLEVVRTWGNGRTSTATVDGFYVPARGSAGFEYWDNNVKDNGSKADDVVSVSVRVVEVRTADLSWKTMTFPVDGLPVTVVVPTAR